ncbi:MAG: hydrolase [candidate division Zixibacteria bacterium]|nr:hydrolase [candidate division Zixibacteria bacterium]
MLDKNNAVLVIVDVQGKLATLMYEKEAFYENVEKLIRGAQALELPIFWNEQLPDKLGETIPQIKKLLPDLKPLVKKSFSCCGNTDFSARLRATGRKQVLLCGMEAHVCVYQTAQDLLNTGYEVYLAADAVSSRTPENRKIGIRAVMQRGGKITSVEMALFEMLHEAEGEQFKQCIKIVK